MPVMQSDWQRRNSCRLSALRSARLPVNLIGSPINYTNRLIGSPITSQSTALTLSSIPGGPDSPRWQAAHQQLRALVRIPHQSTDALSAPQEGLHHALADPAAGARHQDHRGPRPVGAAPAGAPCRRRAPEHGQNDALLLLQGVSRSVSRPVLGWPVSAWNGPSVHGMAPSMRHTARCGGVAIAARQRWLGARRDRR